MQVAFWFIVFSGLVGAGWISHSYFGDDYYGRARVTDGVTLNVGKKAFSLWGIDSPQASDSEAWAKSFNHLEDLANSRIVRCYHTGEFDGDRYEAKCYVWFSNLNVRMVRDGFARDCLAFSKGEFSALQDQAEKESRGLWGEGLMPEAASYCSNG